MSIQAMAWVLKQNIGDPVAKLVLLCLANYAGESGENAFPSVARLMEDTELSERTIREKLSWAVGWGFIKLGNQDMAAAYFKRRDRQTTCYDFTLPPRGAPAAPRKATGCATPQNGVHLSAERGAPPAPNPLEIHQLKEGLVKDKEMPKGREPTFEREFAKRFGSTPK